MNGAYVIFNVFLALAVIVFFAGRLRGRRGKRHEKQPEVRPFSASHFNRDSKPRLIVPMYTPPHFDGTRYNHENALNREGIKLMLTRNLTHSVNRPSDKDLV